MVRVYRAPPILKYGIIMSPLLSYYGGKQRIAQWIISHFPIDIDSLTYIEPFFGGGAVFFQKKPSKNEYILDSDDRLYRFYHYAKNNPMKLFKALRRLIIFESDFKRAHRVINGKEEYKDELDYVCCVYMSICWSFNKTMNCNVLRKKVTANKGLPKEHRNRIARYPLILDRLREATIITGDYSKSIKNFDSPKSFFYLDPPYPETQQVYKHKFNKDSFNDLIKKLIAIQGKFILSFYMKPWMDIPSYWNVRSLDTKCSISNVHKHLTDEDSDRIEYIAMNYKAPNDQLNLF